MLKGLGILAGGIFIGAVGAEIIRRAHPVSLDKLRAKMCQFTDAVRDAFMEGYHGAVGPETGEPTRG